MFTCIACTAKQTEDDGRGEFGSETPRTKEAVKSLTTQIKDMALKFSGAYKQCTGPSTNFKKAQRRPYPDFDTASEGVPYPYIGVASSSSTPAWDFTANHQLGARSDSRFTRQYGAHQTRDSTCDVVLEDEPKEWMAQVEPGVHITFVSLANGGNDLKRIRFSREMFDKWQAQRWWGENYDRIKELYNVQRFNRQALHTPSRSEDEPPRESFYSKMDPARESPMVPTNWTPRHHYKPSAAGNGYFPSDGHHYNAGGSIDASRTTTSSRDDASVSISNASDVDSEWIEHDEPGVHLTIRQLANGTRELRRVRFSRERFGERNAKTWWEENRDRIQAQYL